MKLVGYLRVSTDSQVTNTSLEDQKQKIEAYCQAYNHELIGLYTEVGSGAKSESRPQFQKALAHLDSADGLIATKLDRLARNTRDVLTLVEDVINPKQKTLIILDLNVDTSTPMGMMILTVMSAVASLERDIIRERMQGGRQAKAQSGGFAYGAPPYGFESVNGELVLVESEQQVIGLMRRHRRSGKSFQRVACWLNEQGYYTKQGKQWSAAQVRNVLRRNSLNTEPVCPEMHKYPHH